ncbi:SSU0592/SSU0593 family protein [Streptococcus suis]
MKQLVTKRSYKIGLSAVALVLLMTTAGGAAAHAEEITVYTSPKGSESFISVEKTNIGGFSEGDIKTEPMNKREEPQMFPPSKSGFDWFWGGLKTFWNSWCCGFGLRGLKSK